MATKEKQLTAPVNGALEPPPDHDGVFFSPLRAWPGYVELPHPDAFLVEHWQAFEDAAKAVDEALPNKSFRTDVAVAMFVRDVGQWHIENASIEDMADVERSAKVPIKVRRWLTHCVNRYIADITDPKA